MVARTQLLSNVGKLILKVGAALSQAVQRAEAIEKTLSEQARTAVWEAAIKGQFAKIEFKYRNALVDAQLRCINLPPLEQDAATAPPELRGSDVAPLLTGRHRLCAQLPPCAEPLRLAPAGV